MSRYKYIFIGAVVLVLTYVSINLFTTPGPSEVYQVLTYSEFLDHVEKNEVRDVVMRGRELKGAFKDGAAFTTYIPSGDKTLDLLLAKRIYLDVRPPDDAPSLLHIFIAWLPLFLLLGSIWYFITRPLVRIERRLQILEQAIPKQQNADRE